METMSNDMLFHVMTFMSLPDVRRLCSITHAMFEKACRLDFLKRRARLELKSQVTKEVNVLQHVDLLERGFKTIYLMQWNGNKWEVSFDIICIPERMVSVCQFALPGLPRPKGSKVWIFGYIDVTDGYAAVCPFDSLEDIREAIRSANVEFPLSRFYEYHEDTLATLEMVLNEEMEEYFCIEVELP